MLPDNLTFVDLETTGIRMSWDRVIEVGIIRVENNQIVEKYENLINPERYIDPFILKMTGIDESMLKNAPTFYDIHREILSYFYDSVLVAHNARFDYGFLKSEFSKLDISFSVKQLCTVRLARLLYPGYRSYALDSIIERHKIPCRNRHRALDDAQVIWDFYRQSQVSVGADILGSAVKSILKRQTLPASMDESDLKDFPEAPGVYIFYDEARTPLYIGKSKNLKYRILSHFNSDINQSTDQKLSQTVKSIKTIPTAGEFGALVLESNLIKTMQPVYNRRLRHGRKLIILKKEMAKGYSTVTEDFLNDMDFSDLSGVMGVFKSKKQMMDTLYSLCNDYKLCPKLMRLENTPGGCFNSQLGNCLGACSGKENVLKYNLRFEEAFYKYKIKTWPFTGPIIIEEKSESLHDIFLVDNWCLFKIDNKSGSEINNREKYFDYDLYKIIRHLLESPKSAKIRISTAGSGNNYSAFL